MKRTVILLIIVVAALLAMATPAAAKKKERVGSQISLFSPPATFPAGEPFHIAHGWVGSVDRDIGSNDFELEIDGVLRKEDFVSRSFQGGNPVTFNFSWVHNFSDGMTGTHTFTGHWFLPCQEAVDSDLYPGPCPNPNAKVEVLTRSATVSFP